MSKINVRSPYYISTGTTTRLNSQLLELWVYTGTQGNTSRPTTPTYSLESFAVDNVVTFEISELVKDYITQTYSHDAYATEILWVDYRTTDTISGTIQTPSAITELKAFNGYGYFKDGVNPTNNSEVLQTNTDMYLPDAIAGDYEKVVIPVDTSTVTSVVFKDASGGTLETVTVLTSTLSTGQIAYAESQDEDVATVVVNGSGTTNINVYRTSECKYTQRKLSFVNKFGVLQDLWFHKKSTEQLTTTKDSFKRNIVSGATYSTVKHQDTILTKQGKEKITLNSGFYPESFNEIFRQLELSEEVWMTEGVGGNAVTYPVNIASTSLAFKTHINDKLINYTIEVEYANNKINDIR